jgi:N-acyl-D-aspartate/D-glutamate deacylase
MEKYNLAASETVNPKNFEYITSSKTHPELVGKRFFEVAEALGMDDYWEAIRKILIEDDGETFTGGGGICEEDIVTILRYPACAVSTDGSTRDMPSTVMRPAHPRNYGTYAKILQHYVREEHLLSLENAVRKMSSLPASFLGLTDRGLIRPGSWADLTVFDSEHVENKATFAEPDRFPTGIEYVIVNGEIVAEKGKRTESLPGKVLDRTDRQ